MSLLLDRLYHLHWVTPELARSAQPYLGAYGAFLKPHRFKSIINLRGENPAYRWWQTEKELARAGGILHFDVKMSSRNLPARGTMAALFDAFEQAPTPLLVKCSGGQDRSSLASALWLLWRKKVPLAEAEGQFALWPYLHWPKPQQRWLKHFPAYALGETGDGHLGVWARTAYAPEHFAAWLKTQGREDSYRTIQAETPP